MANSNNSSDPNQKNAPLGDNNPEEAMNTPQEVEESQ